MIHKTEALPALDLQKSTEGILPNSFANQLT